MYYQLTLPQQVFCKITGWHINPVAQTNPSELYGQGMSLPIKRGDIALYVCWLRHTMHKLQASSMTTLEETDFVIKAIEEFKALYNDQVPPSTDARTREIFFTLDYPDFRKGILELEHKLTLGDERYNPHLIHEITTDTGRKLSIISPVHLREVYPDDYSFGAVAVDPTRIDKNGEYEENYLLWQATSFHTYGILNVPEAVELKLRGIDRGRKVCESEGAEL